MAVQRAVRIVCDGCGLEAEWIEQDEEGTIGAATSDARDRLKRARWKTRDKHGDDDLCLLCVRCEKQQGRLVVEPPMPLFARSP